MKKTALLTMVAATMIMTTGVGFASPQTDYSAGKTSIDVMWRNAGVTAKSTGADNDLDKKGNLDFGITTGLGSNFAIQYAGYDAKSALTTLPGDSGGTYQEDGNLKIQEFNILYKIDKNVSVYTGLVSAKSTVSSEGQSFSSDNKKKVQFGIIGSTKVADKTTVYGQIGVASDFTNWKVGVSQEVAQNVEVNIDYRSIQAKKLKFDGGVGDADITAKGLGFGVSYKF